MYLVSHLESSVDSVSYLSVWVQRLLLLAAASFYRPLWTRLDGVLHEAGFDWVDLEKYNNNMIIKGSNLGKVEVNWMLQLKCLCCFFHFCPWLPVFTLKKSVSWKAGEEMISQTSQISAEKVHELILCYFLLFFLAMPAPQLSLWSWLRDLRSAWTVSCSGPVWWRQPLGHVGCSLAAGGGRWGRSAAASLEDLQDQAGCRHTWRNSICTTVILKKHFFFLDFWGWPTCFKPGVGPGVHI